MKDRILTDRIAEATVLAGLISNPALAYEYLGKLGPEHFSDQANRTVFEACQILLAGGREINTISIDEAVRACGAPLKQRQSALAALSELPDVGHSKLEAATWRLNSLLEDRKVLAITSKVNALIEERPGAAREALVNEAIKLLTRSDGKEAKLIRHSVDGALQMLDEAMAANRSGNLPPNTVPTGFRHLDYETGGLRSGNMVTIGAAPGGGKSTLRREFALNFAKAGHPVFSAFLEMGEEEEVTLFACNLSGVSNNHVFTGSIYRDEKARDNYMRALAELKDLPITLFRGRQLQDIISAYKRWRLSLPEGSKSPVFFLDYIGLVVSNMPGANKEQKIAEISQNLQACAASDNTLVIALTQLNREYLKRPDRRPQLGDSRDSAAVEHDSSVVIYLHNPGAHFETDDKGEYIPPSLREMIVAKGRFGGTGIVNLHTDPPSGRFWQDSGRAYDVPGLIPMSEAIRPGAANQEGGAF